MSKCKYIGLLFTFILLSFSSFSYIEFKSYPVFDEIQNQLTYRLISIPTDNYNEPYLHEINKKNIVAFDGVGYVYQLPDHINDYIAQVGPLGGALFENNYFMPQSNCFHEYIKTKGKGRNSFYTNGYLYFSTSDNSDPRINKNKYIISLSMDIKNIANKTYKIDFPFELERQYYYFLLPYHNKKYFYYDKEMYFSNNNITEPIHFVHQNDKKKKSTTLINQLEIDYNFYNPIALTTLDHIVFVVGAPRSGTTLMNSIVCGNDCYPTFPECTDITYFLQIYEKAKDYPDEMFSLCSLNKIQYIKNITKEKIDKIILTLISNRDKKNNIAFKDPYLTFYLKYIKDIFEDKLKIVFIVRDMRDIISSWRKVKQKEGNPSNIDDIIQEIILFYNQIEFIEKILGQDLIFVKYEDIATRDETIFGLLDEHLEFQIQRESWQNMSYNMQEAYGDSSHICELSTKNISDTSIGKYKEDLTETECLLVEQVFKKYMKRFNYPFS